MLVSAVVGGGGAETNPGLDHRGRENASLARDGHRCLDHTREGTEIDSGRPRRGGSTPSASSPTATAGIDDDAQWLSLRLGVVDGPSDGDCRGESDDEVVGASGDEPGHRVEVQDDGPV